MKISKKDLVRELPALVAKNDYIVTYAKAWPNHYTTRTVIATHEIEAARVAREQWGAEKIKSIELVREDIWA